MFVIVLLAMVAGFLALRLYGVLGQRSGHEQPLIRAAETSPPTPRLVEATPDAREGGSKPISPGAEMGLRAIVGGEPGFDVEHFVEGAKSAYRMTLEAFWRGDEAALADLVEPDVAAAFGEAIAARKAAGETLENRLVTIERATIVDAEVIQKTARIVMRFDADIAAVTRNSEGVVIAGSLSDAVEVHNVWTFTRTLKSADPNWKLADTDDA